MIGYIRAGNLRVNAPKLYKPKTGETIIRFDRDHPVLGNSHILYDPTNVQERASVIDLYKKDLEFDILIEGPMSKELNVIADRILSGENIIGMCWCKPHDCHVDILVQYVNRIINLKHRSPE